MRKGLAAMLAVWMTTAAMGGVVVSSTETFNKGAVSWGVGGADAFAGWQIAYINRDPNGVQKDRFFFGNDVQRNYGTGSGQPYPGTRSGATQGTLLVQHDCSWGNSNDPATGAPYYPSSNMIAYISFNGTAGTTYQLDGWVNTIQNVAEPPVPPGRDGIHPIAVNTAYAGFPNIRIGLKNGLFDPATDFAGPWTAVAGLADKTWIQSPTVQLTGTGGPMTIILQVANPDTKAGANIMTDTSWDDVRITPEPGSLALIAAGLLMGLRRRQ
jgi:hypothetical protein